MTFVEEPAKKSNKKWWIIGCGGCLGLTILFVVIAAVVGGMGVKALQGASNDAISETFGPSYHPPANSFNMGIPMGKLAAGSDVKNMVVMTDSTNGVVTIALDMTMGETEAKTLSGKDPKAAQEYNRRSADLLLQYSAKSNSSSKIRDIQVKETVIDTAANGRSYPVSHAVMEMMNKGQPLYSAGVIASIPEENNRKVTLLMMGGTGGSSTNPEFDFASGQKALQGVLNRLINESELDDRLLK